MKNIEEIEKTPRLMITGRGKGDTVAFGGYYMDIESDKKLNFIFSVQMGWEHLSVSMPNKTPSWEQMCRMKDIFWGEEECCVQYHPKKSEYVNCHPHCLHIWKRNDGEYLTPPSLLVGFKNEEEKKMAMQIADIIGVKINDFEF